jgi:putative Mn2+ efflux pump MntP
VDLTLYPTAALYGLLALITAGFGVGMLVYQSGATQNTLSRRRANVVGGVLLIIIGGLVLLTQIWAWVNASYAHLG